MITEPITEELREKALKLAKNRGDANRQYRPLDPWGDSNPSITQLNADWTGAIGEFIIIKRYSSLEPTQKLVMYGINTLTPDFRFRGVNIELKTQEFKRNYKRYLINKHTHDKKGDLIKLYILCGIDDKPKKATKFYMFGCVEAEKVSTYPVESRYYSPAYDIPMCDIISLEENSDRSQELVERVFGVSTKKPIDVAEWLKGDGVR